MDPFKQLNQRRDYAEDPDQDQDHAQSYARSKLNPKESLLVYQYQKNQSQSKNPRGGRPMEDSL